MSLSTEGHERFFLWRRPVPAGETAGPVRRIPLQGQVKAPGPFPLAFRAGVRATPVCAGRKQTRSSRRGGPAGGYESVVPEGSLPRPVGAEDSGQGLDQLRGIGPGEAPRLLVVPAGGLDEEALTPGMEHGDGVADQGFSGVEDGPGPLESVPGPSEGFQARTSGSDRCVRRPLRTGSSTRPRCGTGA